METNVCFPTDIGLLYTALRKIIELVMLVCCHMRLSDWRQGKHHIRKVKKLCRRVQQLKHSSSKNSEKKEERNALIIDIHKDLIFLAEKQIEKARLLIDPLKCPDDFTISKIEKINEYIEHAKRQINQIQRRVVEGKSIPHHEKVFSLFEQHTEWISKGKAGVPVELGLKVCIVKDQSGFILHHHVMQNETDEKVAVLMVSEAQKRFPNLAACSFDKGFHSHQNQTELKKMLEKVVLPRKGKLSAINKEVENSEDFKKIRHKHSAVESAINALENHGLDFCPDRGIEGFKRYVSLAVLARNLQILGHMLQQKELKKIQREKTRTSKAA